MAKKVLNKFTLTDEATELCLDVATTMGVSRSSVVEMAIRAYAADRKPRPASQPSNPATQQPEGRG